MSRLEFVNMAFIIAATALPPATKADRTGAHHAKT
jgi:hypothetical protein